MDHTASACVEVAGDGNSRDHTLETKHKIFLSHSGAQKSFVADLCADLMRRDRHAFFDKLRSSLAVGEKFPHLIFDGIRQCEVGVVVLSEEFFTRTKWPMMELAAMVEETKKSSRKRIIIPVFYSISRERCRDGDVQCEWMTKYWRKWEEGDKGRIDVEKWKNALGIFGSTTGLIMKDGMLDGELRAEIVEAICKVVAPETKRDDSHVEGRTRLFVDICKRVYKGVEPKDLKGGVRVVGLYGVGGIGKTTACKILCNELSRDYCDKVCHVELGSKKEVELLQQALKKFSNLDVERIKELDVDECRGYLKSHIAKDRVFLALDNVSDESKEQAKSLLKAKFGDGSVVLVTARSMDQLQNLGVVKENCFTMPELEREEAKSLFLNHAGLKENEVGEDFVEQCVRRCYFSTGQSVSLHGKHYHPLALKVLGSEVGDLIRHGKDERAVLSRIRDFNLSRQKEHPVFSILRSSFDSLLEEDQLLFLDVTFCSEEPTCIETLEWVGMVHGKDGDEVKCMLECLKRRSLLDSFVEHAFGYFKCDMHDLWREFAEAEMRDGKFKDRRFVYKGEGYRGRVDLREHSKLEVVRLLVDGEDDGAVDVRGLKHLKSLEVSVSSNAVAVEVAGLGTLERLTYLDLWNVASSECIAELGLLTKLQVVVLCGFEGDRLPDMSKLTSLRILCVRNCKSLQCINLRNLPNLTYINIERCNGLRSVDISGCRSMKVYEGFWRNDKLEELNVSFCPLISMLVGLHCLLKLRKLDIAGCSSIEQLDGLICLLRLEELRARGCQRLAMLPKWLPKLRLLDIESHKVPVRFKRNFNNDQIEPIEGFKRDCRPVRSFVQSRVERVFLRIMLRIYNFFV